MHRQDIIWKTNTQHHFGVWKHSVQPNVTFSESERAALAEQIRAWLPTHSISPSTLEPERNRSPLLCTKEREKERWQIRFPLDRYEKKCSIYAGRSIATMSRQDKAIPFFLWTHRRCQQVIIFFKIRSKNIIFPKSDSFGNGLKRA